jgi:ABC-type uncharacterized transport system substrate-binding protein
MIKRIRASACAALLLLLSAARAHAHPHVWVTLQSEILYASDGTVTGVRHAWRFDDMFSSYALQGISHAKKRASTRGTNSRRSPR